MNDSNVSIQERTKQFALRAIKVYGFINEKSHFNSAEAIISKQFFRSSTSVGANIEEAQAGQSTADFISKLKIALKEARETRYWLRLLVATELVREERLIPLINEANELMNIVGAIIVKTQKNNNRK